MSNKFAVHHTIDPEIASLAAHHGGQPEAVLEVLQALQAQRGGLKPEWITDVALALHMPPRTAFGVASFYSMLALKPRKGGVIRVCDGPVCWLKHASQTQHAIAEARAKHPDWTVERSSCLGMCDRAPAALVEDEQAGPIAPKQANKLYNGWRGHPRDYTEARPNELRVMMSKAGFVNPDDIASALKYNAYHGLAAALMRPPRDVINEVISAGLTGRGGAGFPVGQKWRFVAMAMRTPKYVVCNADESEPLIFKDRVLIDTNPQQILEGMAIAGYATGANEGYIYIRGEYESQAQRLERAIQQAEAAGWLGENIQKSGFSFHLHVHRGAGAYVCGEETALIESLEGHRGEPRLRPPYPPSAGFRSLPTLVNNVESYASVPIILANGARWYRNLSDYTTSGTKIYMVMGHVNRPGLFEAPFGLTLRQIINDYADGMLRGSTFNFALAGGAAGTIVPPKLLDVQIDYTSAARGVSLGAGAFLICDQHVSPVAFLRELLHFFAAESCGKCTPCRVGTHRALQILTRMAAGHGVVGDVDELTRLADVMADSSFCGLGQAVPIPLRSALTQFAGAFAAAEAHQP